MRSYKGNSPLHEIIPLHTSEIFPTNEYELEMLHKFAQNNPMYDNSFESNILGIPCKVYEGDTNDYWLDSIKHDTSYAPFYPVWIISAYALALESKKMGIEQVVDIGSGDGRIAYCNQVVGIKSHGIEIDENLVTLQEKIVASTGIEFNPKQSDATQFDYESLNLSHPGFFIGGLPEVGEMLANNIIKKITAINNLKNNTTFILTGSHIMRKTSRDQTKWGWGQMIDSFGLNVIKTITLPTHWTVDQPVDTPYIFTARTYN